MPKVPFEDLPDSSRIWIFSADRPCESEELEILERAIDDFLEDWNAHGRPLRAGRDSRYDRFLIVGVDDESVPPSGCSIDALVRVFKEKEAELGVRLLDRGPVWYRAGEGVQSVGRADFKAMARAGEVGADTIVFDGSITRLGDLRGGRWELPAGRSWHASLLPTADKA